MRLLDEHGDWRSHPRRILLGPAVPTDPDLGAPGPNVILVTFSPGTAGRCLRLYGRARLLLSDRVPVALRLALIRHLLADHGPACTEAACPQAGRYLPLAATGTA